MKWVNLSARTKLRLTGPDRVRFLNGQVSNQIDQDLSGRAISACVCNLKGRIEALVFVTAKEDALFIDCDAELREALLARLDRYLIADDCEFEDVTDDFQLWHGLGVVTGAISERFGENGADVWIPVDEVFSSDGDVMNAEAVEVLRIQRGIPKWGHELTGEEFPAEVGLDKRAVDFHKGCYLGQEIISRIESVGKVKRVLIALASKGGAFPLNAGESLTVEGENVGAITSVFVNDDETIALGLVKRSFTEAAEAGRLPNGLLVREI